MPNVYIKDDTLRKLRCLSRKERRSLSMEFDVICDLRMKQLNLQQQDDPSNNANIKESQSMTG
jgi:hypothetical protein